MKRSLLIILLLNILFSPLFSITDKDYTRQYNKSMSFWEDVFIPKRILAGNIEFTEQIFTSDALAFLSKEELRLLRNMIYAKHGKIFKSSDLSSYFSKYFEWYTPLYNDVDNLLTENEKQNINLIQIFESGYKTTKNIPEGYWRCFDLQDLSKSDLSELYLNEDYNSGKGTIKYYLPNKYYFNTIISYEGTYSCENGFLIINITKLQLKKHQYIYEDYEKDNKVEFRNNEIIDLCLSNKIELRFPFFIDNQNDCILIGDKRYFR